MEKELFEEQLETTSIFHGKVLDVSVDSVRIQNGEKATREIIHHKGAVAILPLDDQNNVIMEKQYRYAQKKVLLEIPAGKLESREEVPLEAAKRELSEETGFLADEWIPLGTFVPSPAILEEKDHLFLAKGLHEGPTHPDKDEFLIVERIPLSTLYRMVLQNKIEDGKTAYAILRAYAEINDR